MMRDVEPLYAEARRVLLDALEALGPHRHAAVVVGAQAVYLRAGPIGISVTPFTTDGDIALDPTRLKDRPRLSDAMGAAGFRLEPEEHPEPGIWVMTKEVAGRNVTVPIDLIVPSGLASTIGRRGARLGPHGNVAARKIPGLEAAIVDNDVIAIEGLADDDERVVEAKVAGPTALLIAKAHKIQERLTDARRPDRILDKDAGDTYRLMQTTDPERCARVAVNLVQDARVGEASRSGIGFLLEQFRAPASAGTTMAIRYYRGAVPEERVRTICNGFIAAFEAAAPPVRRG